MSDCTPIKLPSDPNQRLTLEMSPTTDEQRDEMKRIPYREAGVFCIWFNVQGQIYRSASLT